MKVLAFNSSPNLDKGGTGLILTPFLEGMRQAGAEVELFHVRKLNIKPCLGDKSCWLRTPGECVQEDDMGLLYPKLAACDIIVIATPVYIDGMTGTMKMLIDRFIALLEPFVEIRDGHSRHPTRKEVKPGKKLVLVSVCGFTEMDNFDALLTHVQTICKNFGWHYAGALLRPYAVALPSLERSGIRVEGIFKAARDAGEQLVKHGEMASDTLAAVSRELVSREKYVESRNISFREALSKLETK